VREGSPRLLAVSTGSGETAEALLAWARALAAAGVDALSLREPGLTDRELLARARALAASARADRPQLLVSARADVALAAGADGVHLPAAGLAAERVRRWVGRRLLLGVSTHRVEEVAAAREAGADYVVFGPVYPTPSKPGWVEGNRLAELERAAALGPPVLAIGGVTIDRLGELARAGAAGAAGIRAFQEPAALPELAAEAARCFGSRDAR
jgi:thiamine-phosphate pyrophosphorylase